MRTTVRWLDVDADRLCSNIGKAAYWRLYTMTAKTNQVGHGDFVEESMRGVYYARSVGHDV